MLVLGSVGMLPVGKPKQVPFHNGRSKVIMNQSPT